MEEVRVGWEKMTDHVLLQANSVPDAAAFRLDVFSALNCTFDNGQAPELLMWEFWLCLAARGHWGGVHSFVLMACEVLYSLLTPLAPLRRRFRRLAAGTWQLVLV